MKIIYILFLINLIPSCLLASENFLHGNIKAYSNYGDEEPMTGAVVSILYNDEISSIVDPKGRFRLDLNKETKLKAGSKITLKVDEQKWTMLTPYQGVLYIPQDLDTYVVEMKLVSNKSRLVLGSLNASFSSRNKSETTLKPVYSVQVLLSTSRNKAFDTRRFFIEKGFKNTFIQVTKASNNTVYYKVIAGSYPSKKRANAKKKTIRKKYPDYRDAFVKLIVK